MNFDKESKSDFFGAGGLGGGGRVIGAEEGVSSIGKCVFPK